MTLAELIELGELANRDKGLAVEWIKRNLTFKTVVSLLLVAVVWFAAQGFLFGVVAWAILSALGVSVGFWATVCVAAALRVFVAFF